jgi:acetyltransferase-like isoleucine patch superfamily enzyme
LSLKGEILISDNIHYGMLKIGISDAIRSYESVNLIDIDGLLNVFSGNVLRQGIKLRISNNGRVVLNRNVYIGDNNTLISDEAIFFGANTRVGNNSTFIDTDFHYMINTKTREVKNNKSAIIIGENNWIGGWCTIKKGAITPTATILAGPYSMISKDYTKIIGENSIIGGTPAKLLVDGYRRVSSLTSESNIANHYGSTKEIYTLEQNIGIDYFCIPKSIED